MVVQWAILGAILGSVVIDVAAVGVPWFLIVFVLVQSPIPLPRLMKASTSIYKGMLKRLARALAPFLLWRLS